MSWWRILALVAVAWMAFSQWQLVLVYLGKIPFGMQYMEPNANFLSKGWLGGVVWTAALIPLFFASFPAVIADLLLIWTAGRAMDFLRALNAWHPYSDFAKGGTLESHKPPLVRQQVLSLSIMLLVSAAAIWRFGWR